MTPFETRIAGVVESVLEDYRQNRDIDQMDIFRHPDKDVVVELIGKLRRIIFPGYFRDKNYYVYNAKHNLSMLIEDVMFNLSQQIMLVLRGSGMEAAEAETQAQELSIAFFERIPQVRAMVQTD